MAECARAPMRSPSPAALASGRPGFVASTRGRVDGDECDRPTWTGKSGNPLAVCEVWARRDGGCRKATQQCKCGWLGHPRRGCRCTPTDLAQHAARVSGPVLDRLDLQIQVPALTSEELLAATAGEPSAAVRARVLVARVRQRARGGLNAHLPNAALRGCAGLDDAGRRLVADAVDRGGMSARAVHRALRVARTIADLAGEEGVSALRLAEALQYRAYEARGATVTR